MGTFVPEVLNKKRAKKENTSYDPSAILNRTKNSLRNTEQDWQLQER